MRRILLGLVVLLLTCGSGLAAVSVSPVMIEELNVQAGQSFEILCRNWGEEPVELELSLALFDQDQSGSVFFLEDELRKAQARDVLNLNKERLLLPPDGGEVVKVELNQANFDHLYAVLFVKPIQANVHTRFAVLFLLSTSGRQAELNVASWEQDEHTLLLTVQNTGLRHGPWEGEVLLLDASGQVNQAVMIQSGIVLAGRSREVEVTLPSWVHGIEMRPVQAGRLP